MSVIRFDGERFRWEGIEPRAYKEGEGDFSGIARHTLLRSDEASFELRYFELEPGGYSSLEKHQHIHFVIALRGAGKALVGGRIVELKPFDALYVPPLTVHRFMNEGEEPFGFLCPVDAQRDRPQPVEGDAA